MDGNCYSIAYVRFLDGSGKCTIFVVDGSRYGRNNEVSKKETSIDIDFSMENETVLLLDIPNELLLIIIQKLCFIDVLYSFLTVNKRLDRMANINQIKCLDFYICHNSGRVRQTRLIFELD
jgi:hypothetical protein